MRRRWGLRPWRVVFGTLQVLADAPMAAITTPAVDAKYGLGQTIVASYGCQEGTGGPGITSCAGPVANGAPINTSTTGTHTFSVTATSGDGETGNSSANYTVVESQFSVRSHGVNRRHQILLGLSLPYAGSLNVRESAAGVRSLTRTITVAAARSLSVYLAWLRPGKRRQLPKRIQLRIAFTPNGGTVEIKNLTVRLAG